MLLLQLQIKLQVDMTAKKKYISTFPFTRGSHDFLTKYNTYFSSLLGTFGTVENWAGWNSGLSV
jgi:hypothetical protein